MIIRIIILIPLVVRPPLTLRFDWSSTRRLTCRVVLAITDIYDYYRIPIVNTIYANDLLDIQIKVPLVLKNTKKDLKLLRLIPHPFKCPVKECIAETVWELKLRDDLVVTDEQSAIASSRLNEWQCSSNFENKICFQRSAAVSETMDPCIKALFERNLQLAKCSVKRVNTEVIVRPIPLSATEVYQTDMVDGTLMGQVVKIGGQFDPKLPSWSLVKFLEPAQAENQLFTPYSTSDYNPMSLAAPNRDQFSRS